jgi:hypothetical protein
MRRKVRLMRAAVCGIFGFFRTLVRVHAVHPAGVDREAHDKERIVRQRDALCHTPHPHTRTLAFAVTVERSTPLAMSIFVLSIMVRCTPSERLTMREPRTTSTVLSGCVALDDDVVDWVLPRLFDVCVDRRHRGCRGGDSSAEWQ